MPESQRPDEGPGPWRPERMKSARVQAGTEALSRRETALSKRSVANHASDSYGLAAARGHRVDAVRGFPAGRDVQIDTGDAAPKCAHNMDRRWWWWCHATKRVRVEAEGNDDVPSPVQADPPTISRSAWGQSSPSRAFGFWSLRVRNDATGVVPSLALPFLSATRLPTRRPRGSRDKDEGEEYGRSWPTSTDDDDDNTDNGDVHCH
ncbi:hypothetical protein CKAH01_01156 [Colletotrichum kahawae]|uniref:Uncharacterized protein n=1 Tax=Colletotrichum kahawae TaxID=34407 RepID=A0AAD9YAJ5_COLKA|nr:hypothetical protein CKAH01_01156 [Colletotrichum kahawae]